MPSTKLNGTTTAAGAGQLNDTVKVPVVPSRMRPGPARVTYGGPSSSRMVPSALVSEPSTPSTALLNSTVNVSVFSVTASSTSGTPKVASRWPAAIVSVRLWAW